MDIISRGIGQKCPRSWIGLAMTGFGGVRDGFGIFLNANEDPQQVLYSGVLKALGYSENRQAFLDLAYKAPYRWMKRMVRGLPSEERVSWISQTLLRATGFSG